VLASPLNGTGVKIVASKHPRSTWTVREAPRRARPLIEIRNGRGPVAVVYTNERDARLMAAAPRMLNVLRALLRAGQSTQAHADAIADAKALIAEVSA